jgi:RND superfamily putative drug exporter
MLVPSPAFRSMSLGIMLSVVFVLAATMTLLPAVLAKLSSKVDRLALKWAHSSEHRSARFAAWGERLCVGRCRTRCLRWSCWLG